MTTNRTVIRSTEEVTAEWLQRHFPTVQSVHVETVNEGISNVYRIHCTHEAQGPTSLILKLCKGEFGPSEVEYFTKDYADLENAPIPTCYDAAYDTSDRQYHILMEDLGESHRNNWQTTPDSLFAHDAAIQSAKLHAHVWGPDAIQKRGYELTTDADLQRYIDHIAVGLEPMLAESKDEIDPSWPEIVRDLMSQHPKQMSERLQNPHGYALLHGDLNPGNILTSREPGGRMYFIDRQPFDWSLRTWLAVSDLAYLMVTWWPEDVRRELEMDMLKTYHQNLLQIGISDYSWEQLVSDYKLCIVQSLYVAIEWCRDEEQLHSMKWVWLPQLRRSMTAYLDWQTIGVL